MNQSEETEIFTFKLMLSTRQPDSDKILNGLKNFFEGGLTHRYWTSCQIYGLLTGLPEEVPRMYTLDVRGACLYSPIFIQERPHQKEIPAPFPKGFLYWILFFSQGVVFKQWALIHSLFVSSARGNYLIHILNVEWGYFPLRVSVKNPGLPSSRHQAHLNEPGLLERKEVGITGNSFLPVIHSSHLLCAFLSSTQWCAGQQDDVTPRTHSPTQVYHSFGKADLNPPFLLCAYCLH